MARAFSLDRRALLKGTFGAAVALPLLEAMYDRKAFAQAAAPTRFVFVYCGIPPCGEGIERGTGKAVQHVYPDAAGPFSAPFKIGLEPLEKAGLKPDTTVISSLRIPRTGSGNGRRYGSSGFHYETMGPIVSGVSDPNDAYSGQALGPSCDWLVSEKIGKNSRFPLLVYMAQSADHSDYHRDYISYRPSNQSRGAPTFRNDPIISPRVAFDRLFTGFTPPTGGSAPPPVDPELKKRADILARVQQSYGRLKAKLGTADRTRLDAHLENVHALEQRLSASLTPPPAVPGGICAIPTRPDVDPATTRDYADEDLRAANFVDLTYMALACDLSRVVSFEITSSMSGVVLPTSLGITYRNWDGRALNPGPLHEATHGQGDHLTVAECIRWHVKHLANLAKKLKDTPEGSGTMLDRTAIVFIMEAGVGNTRMEGGRVVGEEPPHTSEGMAAVVVGGKSLGMQLGTHIVAPNFHPAGVSLSAMRAVAGADIASLGEITAEIPGLRT
jgi:hypothetical protein